MTNSQPVLTGSTYLQSVVDESDDNVSISTNQPNRIWANSQSPITTNEQRPHNGKHQLLGIVTSPKANGYGNALDNPAYVEDEEKENSGYI